MYLKNNFIKKIYLLAVLGLHCSMDFSLVVESGVTLLQQYAGSSRCSGFSRCEAQVLWRAGSVAAARGLSGCSFWALEHRLKNCGAWLCCSKACGIFPHQRLNPCLLHWQVDSLPLSHQKPQNIFIYLFGCPGSQLWYMGSSSLTRD